MVCSSVFILFPLLRLCLFFTFRVFCFRSRLSYVFFYLFVLAYLFSAGTNTFYQSRQPYRGLFPFFDYFNIFYFYSVHPTSLCTLATSGGDAHRSFQFKSGRTVRSHSSLRNISLTGKTHRKDDMLRREWRTVFRLEACRRSSGRGKRYIRT